MQAVSVVVLPLLCKVISYQFTLSNSYNSESFEPPRGKKTMWFPIRSDTNRPVQTQKRATSLKFRIYVEEELYYPSSENKGADQLRGYREADLRLCFRICKLLVFPRGGSFVADISVASPEYRMQI